MRSRAWVLVAALIFASPLLGAPAPADEPVSDAVTIRAHVRAAAGDVPSAYRETDEIAYSNGTTTVEHDYVRGKDHRYVYDSGPVHTEEGLLGGDEWSMNANGQVIVDDPDDRSDLVEPDAPKDVVTPVKTPVDGYLIAAIDKRGRGTKEYVDPTTVARRPLRDDHRRRQDRSHRWTPAPRGSPSMKTSPRSSGSSAMAGIRHGKRDGSRRRAQ
jgi:hypothetical protein